MTEASEDFGGVTWNRQKLEVIEVTRGARWLEVLDERFARRKRCEFGILSCLVIGNATGGLHLAATGTGRADGIRITGHQKSVEQQKITKERYFGPKKRV